MRGSQPTQTWGILHFSEQKLRVNQIHWSNMEKSLIISGLEAESWGGGSPGIIVGFVTFVAKRFLSLFTTNIILLIKRVSRRIIALGTAYFSFPVNNMADKV